MLRGISPLAPYIITATDDAEVQIIVLFMVVVYNLATGDGNMTGRQYRCKIERMAMH